MTKKQFKVYMPGELEKETHLANRQQENPFVGTEYEAMFDANPYKDMYYDPSFWDNIGLSNKAKDANAEYDRLYNEYIAGIYDQQRQDQYNSPSAEAQRMRAAGLNPDLAGLTGDSNTSGMTPPNAGPMSALNGVSPASQALSTFTSILGFATGTLKQIQEIKGLSLANDMSKLNTFKKLEDFALPHIVGQYSARFSNDKDNIHDWADVIEGSSSRIPANLRNDYTKAFTALLSSSRFQSSEAAWKAMSADEQAMRHFTSGMIKFSVEAQKSGYKAQISKNGFDAKYYENYDPMAKAAADNSSNTLTNYLSKFRKDLYSDLYKDFKNGSYLAALLILGMNGFNNSTYITSGVNKLFAGPQ